MSRSYLNAIEFCWYRAMYRLFIIGSHDVINQVLYYTSILPLCYQIDLRKLRFYNVLNCCSDSIVWHILTATSKRTLDTLMADYSILQFFVDAVYLKAVWTKFGSELQL